MGASREGDIIEDTRVLEGVSSQRGGVGMGQISQLKGLPLLGYFFCDLLFPFRIKIIDARKHNLLQVNAGSRRNVLHIFLHFIYVF